MAKAEPFRNLIDGDWAESRARRLFDDRNPADPDDRVAQFQDSTAADVEAAVAAAARAYKAWRLVPAPKRAECVFRMGALLAARKEALAREMAREMGKPLKEARGDVQEAIDVCYYIAGEGRRLHGFTAPSELPDKSCFTTRQPIGVCALITPWNFPMAIPSWKLIPALVCGDRGRGGRAEGGRQPGHRLGGGGRRGAPGASRGGARLVHRFVGDRQAHRRRLRRGVEARVARNGREERPHRLR
jgi:aldehyde dehydrogenase (NAD+)